MRRHITVTRGDALVIVDTQKDFIEGGALAVPQGSEVIPVLNEYIQLFRRVGLPIFATRDWHPANHCSFQAQGGPWPVHCVVNSHGAEFARGLRLPTDAIVVSKPSLAEFETYSGFGRTDFEAQLRGLNVRRLFIGGLATDYCVLHTVLGALTRGFDVFLLKDAIRAVNVNPDDGLKAEQEMSSAGAKMISIQDIGI